MKIETRVDTGYQSDGHLHPVCNKVTVHDVAPKRDNGDDSYGDPGTCWQRAKGRQVQEILNPDE